MADYLEGLYNECTDQDTEQGAFRFGLDFLDDVMATGWDCYMHPAPGRDPKSMDFQPRVKRTDEEYEAALLALKPEGYLMQRIVEKDKKRKREARRCEVRGHGLGGFKEGSLGGSDRDSVLFPIDF